MHVRQVMSRPVITIEAGASMLSQEPLGDNVGHVRSAPVRDAMRVAAENISGVKGVEKSLGLVPSDVNLAV